MRTFLFSALLAIAILAYPIDNEAQKYDMPTSNKEILNRVIVNIHHKVMTLRTKYTWLKGYNANCLIYDNGMASILYFIMEVHSGKGPQAQMPDKLIVEYVYNHQDPKIVIVKPWSDSNTPDGCIFNKYKCRLNVFVNAHSPDARELEKEILAITTGECKDAQQ